MGRSGVARWWGRRATYEVLRTVGEAAQPLRDGLSGTTAAAAAGPLRALVGAVGVALTDTRSVLAFDGAGEHHGDQLLAAAERALGHGDAVLLGESDLPCHRAGCPIRGAVVVPLGDQGALAALSDRPPARSLVQVSRETGRWVAAQLAVAELDRSRDRLARAEVRALRAQISPHFIYNALTAIASFVRTDPERARELILDFAEFTRYSFRAHGELTTLAEELRSIDRYLTIERARFGERLQVNLQIAPEALAVRVPFLSVQPLVENAVRHGLSGKPGVGTVSIVASDAGAECQLTVEDDGVGMDRPVHTSDGDGGQHVGLANVDVRLRAVFGDQFGLVVQTRPGAGTKVSMRIPKRIRLAA